MGGRGVGLARGRPADVGAEHEEGGPVLDGHGPAEGSFEAVEVVGHLAELLDVPAVSPEAAGDVVAVGEGGGAVDGDVVVVVDGDEPTEAEVAGQGGGFVTDPLHEVAVGADDEGAVVDDLGSEAGAEEPFGKGEPDGVAEALAEGPGGDLDPGGVADLGVTGGLGAPLPEGLEVFELRS